jgi:A/G-specific adenine glycosylase
MKADFTKNLLKWNQKSNSREMPWKVEKDPYKIWLSEIILQQTRVEQGLGYYQRFIKAYPTVKKLAAAPDQEVFKLWEGLGYYTRCKNLLATARYISKDLKGVFPNTYEKILSLKGIGPYTAAAISSFAYQLPHAVVDGNVFRVLSRYFGISTPIDGAGGKKLYTLLANEVLDKKKPGIYNQAIMDFGAVICKPQQPLCNQCPQQKDCMALRNNWVQQLPVKEKQLIKKKRWLYYFIIEAGNEILVHRRNEKDIWENLYEFVLYESGITMQAEKKTMIKMIQELLGKNKYTIQSISPVRKQQLTHQTIEGLFIHVSVNKKFLIKDSYEWVAKKQLHQYPFPRFITSYLQDLNIF